MKKIFLTILATTVWFPVLVFAQGLKDAGEKLSDANVGLQGNLEVSVGNIVNTVLYIVGTVFMLLLIYGSFVWLKSAGREGEIERAKKIIIAAVVGTVVILASYAISNFVLQKV